MNSTSIHFSHRRNSLWYGRFFFVHVDFLPLVTKFEKPKLLEWKLIIASRECIRFNLIRPIYFKIFSKKCVRLYYRDFFQHFFFFPEHLWFIIFVEKIKNKFRITVIFVFVFFFSVLNRLVSIENWYSTKSFIFGQFRPKIEKPI